MKAMNYVFKKRILMHILFNSTAIFYFLDYCILFIYFASFFIYYYNVSFTRVRVYLLLTGVFLAVRLNSPYIIHSTDICQMNECMHGWMDEKEGMRKKGRKGVKEG